MKVKHILIKTGKWTAIILGGLILVLLIAFAYSYWQTERRLNIEYPTEFINIKIDNDSASIARGKHLFSVHACNECHGTDLRGKLIADNFALGRFVAPNLTRGKGGLPADYTEQDWLKALKLGIGKDGKTLAGMPSTETTNLPDKDLADIIAYCNNYLPITNELGSTKIGPVIRILTAFGKIKLFPAEEIGHNYESIKQPKQEVSADFGATLAVNCFGCHKANLEGGPSDIPGHPPVPNITSKGRVAKWSEEQFMQTLKTGVTPDGHKIDNSQMPWQRFREFSDVELKALRAYLLTFPKNNLASHQ